MTEKQAENTQLVREDQVHLRPVLGMRPGIYLAVIYSFVLLLILFFILICPGIVRPGSLIILKTEPAGAALRVDGIYRGTSPDRIFVSKGPHSLELVLPGFSPERIDCEIPGRLFASVLFPRRWPLSVKLNSPDPVAALAAAAGDYAAWTFGGEPTATWQIPLSLSEAVYRTGAVYQTARQAAETASGSESVTEILKASARFAVTRASLRDLARAKALADNGGLSPSPVSLVRSAEDIICFLSENPGSAIWLAETLPPESAELIRSSAWYQKQLARGNSAAAPTGQEGGRGLSETLAPPPDSAAATSIPARSLSVDGLSFTGIGEGTLVSGGSFPHSVPVEGFLISNTTVPAPVFADFLNANPQWGPEEREVLIAGGLATGEYLADNGNPPPDRTGENETGIRSVSWYAAEAFCAWLTTRLPASMAMAGYEIRLPTEAEWEYAAKSIQGWTVSGSPVANTVKNLEGGAWEWCNDPYAPLDFIEAGAEAIAAVGSPERSVRGGSSQNAAGTVSVETRASLPPALCSPFVSFRPVIAKPLVR